ncbi:HDOD domain-containing protein [Ideonella livida]|uniref:HDOD domain-containing protein n=1 Tax=Ideonella livida TaxID=2707176 RepID=A0A7C9TJQ1_9BURK|nr:HDOD domain-containing protein [Ideonella livida]NDY91204.1 HDOD domain-containing protein [Ideonella livida]
MTPAPLPEIDPQRLAPPAALRPALQSLAGLDLDIALDDVLAPLQTDAAWTDALLTETQSPTLQTLREQLDPGMLRNLVLATGLTRLLPWPAGRDNQAFWRFSQNTAAAAHWLAGVAEEDPVQAHACGLLHALGGWVRLQLGGGPHPDGRDAERAAALLRAWGVGEHLAHAAAHVPHPTEGGADATLSCLVHVASWCAAQAEPQHLNPAPCPQAVGQRIGLLFTWDAQAGTLVGLDDVLMPPMPPLPTLRARLAQPTPTW